jgi:hypothetical protein
MGVRTLQGGVLAAVLATCVATGSQSASAASDVKIASLDCDSDPQVVELSNSGDEPQDLAGWQLRSDPVETETYDLTPIGVLAAGSSVFIEAGPDAEATFTWSIEYVFRSGDSDYFARLVDAAGARRSEEACAAEAQATSTPEPTPTSAPAPTPTTAPADGVPDGGGPPAKTDVLMTPLAAVVAGASLAGTGSLALLALWLSGSVALLKRRECGVFDLPPPPPPSLPVVTPRRSHEVSEPLVLALAAALAAAILVVLLFPTSGRGK